MKILIADDHQLILDGLKRALQTNHEGAIIDTAQNKAILDKLLEQENYDLLILDIKFGDADARNFIRDLKTDHPELKILILSSVSDKLSVQQFMSAGVEGYIVKSDSIVDILNAVNQILNGHQYLSQEIADIYQSGENHEELILTPREKEVLRIILNEKSIKEIAEELNISTKTVEMHRANLFTKLEVKNLAGLVKKTIVLGLLD